MKACILGGTAIYRLPVYNQIAKETGCDYLIIDDDFNKGLAKFDNSSLLNYKGSLPNEQRILGNFTWVKGMIGLLFKPYDAIVIGGPYCLSGWGLIILSKFTSKKIMSWSHGIYGKERGIRLFVKKIYYKICDVNFVYNQRAVDLMNANGIPSGKNVRVGNSLDTIHELELRKHLTTTNLYQSYFSNNDPVLIFVGRVTKIKRIDMVLMAMAKLKEEGTSVNLFVVGKDVDGVNLLEIASQLHLRDKIYLYGPCYDDEVLSQFFYNADVCVSPGNVGLTAMSALTFGCPVISHNNFANQMPEFEAINPGVTGDFFIENDISDLARVIKNWISINKSDRIKFHNNCFDEIDSLWNIYSEAKAFKEVLNK